MSNIKLYLTNKTTSTILFPTVEEVFQEPKLISKKLIPLLSFDGSIVDSNLAGQKFHFVQHSIQQTKPISFQIQDSKYHLITDLKDIKAINPKVDLSDDIEPIKSYLSADKKDLQKMNFIKKFIHEYDPNGFLSKYGEGLQEVLFEYKFSEKDYDSIYALQGKLLLEIQIKKSKGQYTIKFDYDKDGQLTNIQTDSGNGIENEAIKITKTSIKVDAGIDGEMIFNFHKNNQIHVKTIDGDLIFQNQN